MLPLPLMIVTAGLGWAIIGYHVALPLGRAVIEIIREVRKPHQD